MSLREKNGKWEYRFRLNGVRVTRVTDLEATAENRIRALKAEQKHRDEILKGEKPTHRQIARGFTDASREFETWCKVKHEDKPNTHKRVSTSLWSLREWFGNQNVASIRPSAIERYKTWRLATHKVQPVTLRHDLDALSKLFEWARLMDLCHENPVSSVEKPSTESAVRMHVVTPAEEFEYFHRIEEHGFASLADVARLILDQGMRPDEVMTLERRGVDLDNGRVQIFQGKTKAARRTLKLTPECRLIVERRYRASGGRWLLPSPKGIDAHLTKLNNSHNAACAERKGDPNGKPDRPELRFVLYDLRHTFATRAAERGMPVPTLAAILGHASLRMVTKYVHPTQEHMDAEMQRLQAPPRPQFTVDQAQSERSMMTADDRERKVVKQ